MCGRYSRRRNPERLAAEFDAELDRMEFDLRPDYNIAPGQDCAVIVSGNRMLTSMRWGLVPSWSKTDSGFATRINACAETLTDRSSYRPVLARGRCAIPADCFYE